MKILITGASSGIGRACALRFAEKATRLVLLARREGRLQELKIELSEKFPNLKTDCHAIDIRDSKAIQKLQNSTTAFEDLDALINNAGLARNNTPLQSGEIQDWEEMIDTNVKGLLYVTKAALPSMVTRKKGHILNVGSVAGRWVYPGGNVYNATKFAVRALSDGLRLDLHGTGIRVTNVEPGMVETEFSVVRFQDEEKAKKVYEGMTPLTATDIADTLFWCFDRPQHVNIQELVIFPTDQSSVTQVHRSNGKT